MTITWVLITNGSSAKLLLASNNANEVRLLKEFIHPRTAKKAFDASVNLVDTFKRAKPVHPAIDYSDGVEAHERYVFAKELAAYLEKAHDLNEYEKLIVVASREMLGELRKAFEKSVKKVIEHELGKDLLSMKLSNIDLLEKIREDLDIVSYQ